MHTNCCERDEEWEQDAKGRAVTSAGARCCWLLVQTEALPMSSYTR